MIQADELLQRFGELVELADAPTRSAYIDALRDEAPELADELLGLLAAHEAADDFLEESAVAEAAALVPDMLSSALIGRHLGAWRVDALLHSGGMGSVFRATRVGEDFSQRAALKVVKVGFESPELLARFSSERRMLAAIEHPHIARLLDGGTTGEGLPWLAMEFVEGLPIDAWADRQQLDISGRLALFDQVLDAIACVHENLVTHRDIKPSNVLVDAHGQVKVLDFGIAGLLREGPDAGATGTADRRLSPASAAPEQWRGEPVSTATDVYGLGSLLYTLLSGEPPHRLTTGLSAAEIEALICDLDPPLPSVAVRQSENPAGLAGLWGTSGSRLCRQLEGDLDVIVLKAMAKDASRRYRTVSELRADLDCYRRNQPISARPDSAAYRVRKFLRRHWRGLGAVTAVFLALAIGLVAALWQSQEASRQRDRAQAMNTFMQEVMAEADPYGAGAEKRVRDVLDNASELLSVRFPEQPLLEAALRQSIGSVQVSLMELEKGERNALRALELAGALLPEDDVLLIRAEADLAWIDVSRDNYSAAEARYLDIIDRLGEDHPVSLRAMVHNDLGVSYGYWERYQASVLHLQQAIALDPDSPELSATWISLGYAHDGLGELEDARIYYLKAIESLRARGDAGITADLAHVLNNYGSVLSQEGRKREAVAHYKESLEVRRRVFGADSASVAHQALNIGRLYLEMDLPREALPYLRDAQRIARAEIEPDTLLALLIRASLARATLLVDASGESAPLALAELDEVIAILEREAEGRSSRFLTQFLQWREDAQAH